MLNNLRSTLIYLQLCPRYKLSLFDHIFQSKKEELDSALKALAASGDKKGEADLEKENAKLKEELSSLPELKKKLETLRARVTELSQLAGIMWRLHRPLSLYLLNVSCMHRDTLVTTKVILSLIY